MSQFFLLFVKLNKLLLGKSLDEELIDLQTPTKIRAKYISPTEIEIQWTDPNVEIYSNHSSETIKSLFQKRKYIIQYVIK